MYIVDTFLGNKGIPYIQVSLYYTSVSPSVRLSIYPTVYMSICSSFSLCVCVFVCMCVCMCMCVYRYRYRYKYTYSKNKHELLIIFFLNQEPAACKIENLYFQTYNFNITLSSAM